LYQDAPARSEAAVTSAAGIEDPAAACPQDQWIWIHSDIEAIQAMMQRQRCKSRKARKCLAQPVILANEKKSEGQRFTILLWARNLRRQGR